MMNASLHYTACLLHQVYLGLRGSTGRQQIVVDENPLPGPDGVDVHLKHISAVFKFILAPRHPVRQFAGLARTGESCTYTVSQRRAKDEASRLRPEDEVGILLAGELSEAVHGRSVPRVLQQGHDVMNRMPSWGSRVCVE